jgi:hypothetical protein
MIDADDFTSELNYKNEVEVKFPSDYATEELCSVYERLYSHAMFKKRQNAEDELEYRMNRKYGGKISKSRGEQIGNRLYKEHEDRERRHTAKVLSINYKE